MSTHLRSIRLILPLAAAALLPTLGFCNGLALTAAGTTDGFTLSTFATTNPGNTGCCSGPFGVAVAPTGNIIVSDSGASRNYIFSDTDGQTIASALSSTPNGAFVTAFATAGGKAYGSNGDSSSFVQFNADGTINHALTGVPTTFRGMWGDPVNGHIIATSGAGLIDIDPLANGGLGAYRVIVGGIFPDGVSVSPDGKTAYVAYGSLIGYNIATGAQVFSSSNFGTLSGLDGTGVIASTNSLNGDIIANFNGDGSSTGGIGLLDPTTNIFTVIASGGTRGDYVSPDTNNGTLFLDYSDTVDRLSCGNNCSIGGPPPPPSQAPEPGSVTLLGTGLSVLGAFVRRRFKA